METCERCRGTRFTWPEGQMAESEAGLLPVPCPRCFGTGHHIQRVIWLWRVGWRRLFQSWKGL